MRRAPIVLGLVLLLAAGTAAGVVLVSGIALDGEGAAATASAGAAGTGPARTGTTRNAPPKRVPRTPTRAAVPVPPDPDAALKAAWDAAVALHRAGSTLDALTALVPLRTASPAFFAETSRAALLAQMEALVVAQIARLARNGTLDELRARIDLAAGALLDPAHLAALQRILDAATKKDLAALSAAGADALLRVAGGSDLEQLERHLRRFGTGGAPRGRPDWIDRALAAVAKSDAARAKKPKGVRAAEPLPVEDPDSAEKRRLDQLAKLRQRESLSLLGSIGGGLAWMALHQGDDGHFGADAAAARCAALGHDPPCVAAGAREGRPLAATALSVLALLDFRDQDARGLFEPTLARGVGWLLAQQGDDGSFRTWERAGYSGAIGMMALGQAATASGREDLRRAVERGLAFAALHNGGTGGYRYRLDEEGDLSVTGWYVQAVEAAQNAGAEVPPAMRLNLQRFVTGMARGDAGYAYVWTGGPSRSLAPVGMLGATILEPEPKEETEKELAKQRAAKWRAALAKPPAAGDVYQTYYGVRVLLLLDGQLSEDWRKRLAELASSQVATGPAAGSFPVDKDRWFRSFGVPVGTAFTVLTLEHSLYRR